MIKKKSKFLDKNLILFYYFFLKIYNIATLIYYVKTI